MNFLWSRFLGNKAPKILENFGENSEENPGRTFEKFGELSFCNFSDLTKAASWVTFGVEKSRFGLLFLGGEPPLTLRQEKQYLHFGHLFPCTPRPFSLQCGTFSEEFPQSKPCTTRIWACTTGWRLALLYLCSPGPALGLRVVAQGRKKP